MRARRRGERARGSSECDWSIYGPLPDVLPPGVDRGVKVNLPEQHLRGGTTRILRLYIFFSLTHASLRSGLSQ